jgi:poly-gamma-glutamate synthesis protein (capsule biosynthesis protein)
MLTFSPKKGLHKILGDESPIEEKTTRVLVKEPNSTKKLQFTFLIITICILVGAICAFYLVPANKDLHRPIILNSVKGHDLGNNKTKKPDKATKIQKAPKKKAQIAENFTKQWEKKLSKKLKAASGTHTMTNLSRLEYGTDNEKIISFAVVGDIMMGRKIGRSLWANHSDDQTVPFKKFKKHLKNVDIKIANLEAAITTTNKTTLPLIPCGQPNDGPCCGFKCRFRTNETVIQGVSDFAGFNLLSIENNHMEDFKTGREDTIAALKKHDVPFMDMMHPLNLKNYKGCNVNFFTYDLVHNRKEHPYRMKMMKYQLAKTREEGGFNIVYLHGGSEYAIAPTPKLKKWAKTAIHYGADIVFCTHSHVVLGMEKYHGKHIYYSLGNFVMDQTFGDSVREILMVKFDLLKCREPTNFEYVRGRINDNYQPVLTSVSTDFNVGVKERTKKIKTRPMSDKAKAKREKKQLLRV